MSSQQFLFFGSELFQGSLYFPFAGLSITFGPMKDECPLGVSDVLRGNHSGARYFPIESYLSESFEDVSLMGPHGLRFPAGSQRAVFPFGWVSESKPVPSPRCFVVFLVGFCGWVSASNPQVKLRADLNTDSRVPAYCFLAPTAGELTFDFRGLSCGALR